MNVLIMALGLAVAVVLAANVFGPKTDRPFTIAELTVSRAGIPNRLPAAFLLRARGLGLLAGQLRDAGFVVTSAFRGRALDDAVLADNHARGIPNLGEPGPGPHSECRGLDVGTDSRHTTIPVLFAAVSKTDAGKLASQVIAESNHVHLTFDAGDMEGVGAVFVAANPLFDLDGAASVVEGEASDALAASGVENLAGVFGAGQSTDANSSGVVFGPGDVIPAGVDPSTVGIAPGTHVSPLPDGSFLVESI